MIEKMYIIATIITHIPSGDSIKQFDGQTVYGEAGYAECVKIANFNNELEKNTFKSTDKFKFEERCEER